MSLKHLIDSEPTRKSEAPAQVRAVTGLPTQTGFDYAILDPVIADEARAAADRIRTLTRAAVQDVGRELLAIKKQVKRGQFKTWVEHECGINIRTAQRAMNAAQ